MVCHSDVKVKIVTSACHHAKTAKFRLLESIVSLPEFDTTFRKSQIKKITTIHREQ